MDFKPYAGAIARTATGVLGGVLISKGVPPEIVERLVDPVNQALAGALVVAATTGWSLFQKYMFKKKLLGF